jgi:asparagine synthase (glutamine-hydrolysing)
LAGIYGVIDINNKMFKKNDIYKYFNSYYFNNILNEEREFEYFTYGRSILNKLDKDKHLKVNENIISSFEGIIFNKNGNNSWDIIKNLFLDKKIKLVNKLDANFSLSIFDKKDNKLFLSSDHLGTKNLYYYYSKKLEIFIYASELKVVSKLLRENNIQITLNKDAIYSMLSLSYMIDDITYVEEIKKINPGTILELDINNFDLNLEKYHKFKRITNNNLTHQEVIDNYSKLLEKSVKKQYSIDFEYKKKHIGFLSGGLDSRVSILFGKYLGFKDITTLTFSESNTLDEKIAQEISSTNKFDHYFRSLDNGIYLSRDLEKYVKANDGMISIAGASHLYSTVENFNFSSFGLMHTGLIGDAVFGSVTSDNFNYSSILYNNIAINNSKTIKEYLKKLNDKELYIYTLKTPNAVINGDISASNMIDSMSPFFDKDLLEFSLTVPNKFKYDQKIYFDIFKRNYSFMYKYKWEKTGWYPKSYWINKVFGKIKWLRNGVLNRLGLIGKRDMNPFVYWLKKNPQLKNNIENIFNQNIDLIKDNKLKKLLIDQFNKRPRDKFMVLTILLSYKLHFKD